MEDSFVAFVEERGPALYRYGYLIAGNAHDADDLVQEALLRLRGRWSRVADPEAYTRTIIARLQVSFWRRRRRETLTSSPPDPGRTDVGLDRISNDTGLWSRVARLPARQRTVLVLRYHEGLDDERIAEVLGISRGTVRSQAARALDKLRTDVREGNAVHA
jgi:RNA polymerase sigma-70 factor (sigma-E family)